MVTVTASSWLQNKHWKVVESFSFYQSVRDEPRDMRLSDTYAFRSLRLLGCFLAFTLACVSASFIEAELQQRAPLCLGERLRSVTAVNRYRGVVVGERANVMEVCVCDVTEGDCRG